MYVYNVYREKGVKMGAKFEITDLEFKEFYQLGF